MKSFVHFVQTNVYKSIWDTDETKMFGTMGTWLETSGKYIFSDLSQCYYPKWQACLFKTTMHYKTKKVTIKKQQGSSHRCSEK